MQAIICSSGKVVNVRTLVKNIRDKATEIIKGNHLHLHFCLIQDMYYTYMLISNNLCKHKLYL